MQINQKQIKVMEVTMTRQKLSIMALGLFFLMSTHLAQAAQAGKFLNFARMASAAAARGAQAVKQNKQAQWAWDRKGSLATAGVGLTAGLATYKAFEQFEDSEYFKPTTAELSKSTGQSTDVEDEIFDDVIAPHGPFDDTVQYTFKKSERDFIENALDMYLKKFFHELFSDNKCDIPEKKKEEIKALFRSYGIKNVSFKSFDPSAQAPNIGVIRFGDSVDIFINKPAEKVFQDRMLITRWIIGWLEKKKYISYYSADFSPEMLDAVMRHELGHAVNQHSSTKIKMYVIKSLGLLFVYLKSGQIACVAVGCILNFLDLYMSRDMEREADQFAMDILDAEGIKALHDFFEVLEELFPSKIDSSTNPYPIFSELFSTHPTNQERIAYFKKAYEERKKIELIEQQNQSNGGYNEYKETIDSCFGNLLLN